MRELDYHDTFLAADYSHPGDNIPPIVAVAQHTGRDGAALVRAIATGYEIQVDLVRAISLHEHKIDHVAHLGPSVAAGLGTLLDLSPEVIFHAVGQALHTTTATRQSRKGEISSWKAYAPAFAGKVAIEAVDRAMRGETSPTPIYEGEDGVIAWLLDGPDAAYDVPLPAPGEAKRAILDTYTKEHSAEYQSQALIDLARSLHHDRPDLTNPHNVASIVIHTSHHTHYVIGSGANDPQKYDPTASRETLDHSIPYIFTVALQDGSWDHVASYAPDRAARAGHGRAVAEGHHDRGPGVDRAVPLERPGAEGVRRSRRDHDHRRRGRGRRARRGRRPPAGRPAVRPRAVRGEVPFAGGRGARDRRDRAVPRRRAAAAVADRRRARRSDGRRPRGSARHRQHAGRTVLMLYATTTPADKRVALRDGLASRTPPAAARRVQPAVRPADRGQGLRRRLRLRRGARRRPRAAGHRPDDGDRGHAARRADRADDRPARDRRRGHRASASP